jgi:hypothetical protein
MDGWCALKSEADDVVMEKLSFNELMNLRFMSILALLSTFRIPCDKGGLSLDCVRLQRIGRET